MSFVGPYRIVRRFIPSGRPADPPHGAAGRLNKARVASLASALLVAAGLFSCTSGTDSSLSPPPTVAIRTTASAESQTSAPTQSPALTARVPGIDFDTPFVAEGSIDEDLKRMNVTLGGKTYNIKNGGQIILGDGYAVEIYIDPFPPSTLRTWLDLYLTLDGEPVSDASMGMEYDMLAMVHGPFWGEAEKVGEGHYLFVLDYIMFGPWDQMLTIRLDLERIRFPVVLVSYP